MTLKKIKVLRSHGRPYVRDLDNVVLPEIFCGRPVIKKGLSPQEASRIAGMCPGGAFSGDPVSIDLGRCVLCRECSFMAPEHIKFTNDYRTGTNVRENLVVTEHSPDGIMFDAAKVRDEVCRLYGRALKLREVSAGGDNSTEMELGASLNVNFDFGRYGIDFVASPRHADGIVITGPITAGMAAALEICYCAVAEPKIIIMAGCDAVSGGVFAGSSAIDRTFLKHRTTDLWLPGNPVHPMTFIDGVRTLLKHGKR